MGSSADPGGRRRGRHLSGQRVRKLEAGVLHRGRQPAGRARRSGDPFRSELAELRDQRHDPSEQLGVQRRYARQPGHAVRSGTGVGQQLRRLRHVARHEVPDAPLQVERNGPAAPRRHLVLQRSGQRVRQLRALHAAGELRCARRVVGPQPSAAGSRVFRSERRLHGRRAERFVVRQVVAAGHQASGSQRVDHRHRAAAHEPLVGARLRPLSQGHELPRGHEQHRTD